MSLLDDVSIVVTPNGYKAGELYAVLPVPTEGAEDVVDGNFPSPNVNWIKGSNWTIANNLATSDGSQTGNVSLKQLNTLTNLTTGTTYRVQFTISGYVAGVINPHVRGVQSGNVTGDGIKTSYITAGSGSDGINLYAGSNFEGSISNVSVKEALTVSADMDVTRNTAATRVDEDGLVNYAEILGSELAICGDFECASPLTGWTVNSDGAISIDSGKLKVLNVTNRGRSYRTYTGLTIGKTYEAFVGNISGDVGGYCHITSGTTNNNITLNAPFFFVAGTTTADFQCGVNSTVVDKFTFFDNISLKQNDRNNVPRIDYTGGGCPHILAEPQRTNLIPYSEDFSNAAWSKSGSVTIESNSVTSPSGILDGSKLVSNNATSNQLIKESFGVNNGNDYTLSCFVKKQGFDYIHLRFEGGGGSFPTKSAFFNINNGTLGTIDSGITATIEDYNNGWYRVTATNTATATATATIRIQLASSDNTDNVVGNGTSGTYIWGAQVEEGSYATSYIPNSGTALGVTRNQDIFTRDGIGSLINDSEGTLYFEGSALENGGSHRIISLSDGTWGNLIYMRVDSTASRFRGFARGSIGSFTIITVNSIPQTDNNKIALVWDATNFRIWINGSERATATIYDLPVGMHTLNLTDVSGTVDPFYGKVKQLQVYKTALSDEQLLQLTGESGTDFYESYAEMASALTYTIQ